MDRIYLLDSQDFGGCGDRTSAVVGRIVEHDQQPLAWVGGTYLLEQLHDSLAVTRLANLQADQFMLVGE